MGVARVSSPGWVGGRAAEHSPRNPKLSSCRHPAAATPAAAAAQPAASSAAQPQLQPAASSPAGGQDGVVRLEAVQGAVLHAHGNHATARAALRQGEQPLKRSHSAPLPSFDAMPKFASQMLCTAADTCPSCGHTWSMSRSRAMYSTKNLQSCFIAAPYLVERKWRARGRRG